MRASLLLAVIFVCMGPLQAIHELEHVAYSNLDPPVITEPGVLVASMGMGGERVWNGVLSVPPTPTDGLLVLRISGDGPRPGMLRVRIMDGRKVMVQRIAGPELRMDVHGLARGAYVLEFHH